MTMSLREVVDRIRATFTSKSTTWINLEPLSYSAIANMVSRTLRRPKEECANLSRLVHAASLGNAFSARNILVSLHRHHHVWFFFYRGFGSDLIDNTVLDHVQLGEKLLGVRYIGN